MRKKILSAAAAAMLVTGAAVTAGVVAAAPAMAEGNGLALTPPMGFNDWNAFGWSQDAGVFQASGTATAATEADFSGFTLS